MKSGLGSRALPLTLLAIASAVVSASVEPSSYMELKVAVRKHLAVKHNLEVEAESHADLKGL